MQPVGVILVNVVEFATKFGGCDGKDSGKSLGKVCGGKSRLGFARDSFGVWRRIGIAWTAKDEQSIWLDGAGCPRAELLAVSGVSFRVRWWPGLVVWFPNASGGAGR